VSIVICETTQVVCHRLLSRLPKKRMPTADPETRKPRKSKERLNQPDVVEVEYSEAMLYS